VWLLAAAAACSQEATPLPATAQVLLHVDTDAPLPGGASGSPNALFDRLRVTFIPPDPSTPCGGCTQDFALTTALLSSRLLSVGAPLPPGQAGWLAHVQMYPQAFASALGDPDPDTTVDVTASIPPLADTGVVDLTLLLSTADVGQPVGTAAAPVQPVAGTVTTSQVGSWAPAKPTPCTQSARTGEVCVPGGAFWMGTSLPVNPPHAAIAYLHPRLVTLSPFFLGATEVTVAAFRKFASPQQQWTGSMSGASSLDWCTFTATPGALDDHPINCIVWDLARGYCRSIGADLPTEAQWEYAAGGLVGSFFVWGTDLPQCGDGVWGKGGAGYFGYLVNTCTPPARPTEAPAAFVDGGHGLDKLSLDGGTIYDLAGNVSEWTLDAWDSPDGPCWGTAKVYTDPVCGDVASATYRAVRGGGWYLNGNELPAVTRTQVFGDRYSVTDGFRCARPGM